jgi:hypothetical protein
MSGTDAGPGRHSWRPAPADPRPAAPAAPAAARLPRIVSTDTLAAWQQRGPVLLLDVRTDVFAYLAGTCRARNTSTPRPSERAEAGFPPSCSIPRRTRGFSPAGRADGPAGGDLQRRGDPQHRRHLSGVAAGRLQASGGVRPGRRLLQVAAGAAAHRPEVPAHPRVAASPTVLSTRGRRPGRGAGRLAAKDRAAGRCPPARPVRRRARGTDAPRAHSRRDQSLLAERPDEEGFGYVWKDRTSCAGLRGPGESRRTEDIIAYCNSATEAATCTSP